MNNADRNSEMIIRPGRLGIEKMTLATDPRTDPRMLDGMIAVGLDVPGETPPFNPDSPIDQLLEFGSGTGSLALKLSKKLFYKRINFNFLITDYKLVFLKIIEKFLTKNKKIQFKTVDINIPRQPLMKRLTFRLGLNGANGSEGGSMMVIIFLLELIFILWL